MKYVKISTSVMEELISFIETCSLNAALLWEDAQDQNDGLFQQDPAARQYLIKSFKKDVNECAYWTKYFEKRLEKAYTDKK